MRSVVLGLCLVGVGCRGLPVQSAGDEGGGAPVALKVLAYLPNRVLDALEVVRCGVGVGPGMGVDLRVTRLGQLAAMSGLVAGLGWQGRRASPVLLDARSFLAAGPVTVGATSTNPVLSWPRTFWEVGGEVHAGLVLAQAKVDLFQVYDFAAGLLFFDPAGDDFFGP